MAVFCRQIVFRDTSSDEILLRNIISLQSINLVLCRTSQKNADYLRKSKSHI